jgi:predicted Zn-dependent peptidase
MRNAVGLIAAAIVLLSGSAPAVHAQQAAAKTQRPDPVIVRETGPLPSYKDLNYPTLGTVKVPKPEIFTLDNGLKVYLLENHELPLVSGRALVRTGNLFDPKEKRGLAEVTGMVMRSGGTEKMTGDQLDETLENMAASVESGIGESNGSASFSCLKENTDAVLAIFYDVLTQPAFREEKLDLAKTQIKSAISRRNDNAPGIARRELYSLVYGPDTPYGGEEEYDTINAITRKDAVDFYKRAFFPSNIILSVYGDFDSAAMKQKLTTIFGKWTAAQPKMPPFPKVDASPDPGIYLVSKKDVTQTFIEMGHLGGELNDKDFPALSVAADVFGGGFSSRLFREIRTRLGYAYSVGADWGANYDHPGVFRIGVSTKTQTTTDTIKMILKVLDEMRTSEITDDELKVAKDSVLNSLVFAFERPSSTLNRLVTYDYFGYPADFLTEYQKALEGVTKQDVLRVAKQYFQPSKLTIIAVGNDEKFGEPLTALNLPVKPLDVSIPPPHEKAAAASAETLSQGRDLIAKAISFVGGEAKLNSIHDITRVEEAQMQTPQGPMSLKATSQRIMPDTFREEQQRGPVTVTFYLDAHSGWVHTPKGTQDMPAEMQDQVREQASQSLTSLLVQLPKQEKSAVATGDGKVQVKTDAGSLVTLKINPSTGAIENISYMDEGGPVTETFSDWRDVSGVKLPFKSETTRNGKPFQSAVASEVRINTGLKPEELSKRP